VFARKSPKRGHVQYRVYTYRYVQLYIYIYSIHVYIVAFNFCVQWSHHKTIPPKKRNNHPGWVSMTKIRKRNKKKQTAMAPCSLDEKVKLTFFWNRHYWPQKKLILSHSYDFLTQLFGWFFKLFKWAEMWGYNNCWWVELGSWDTAWPVMGNWRCSPRFVFVRWYKHVPKSHEICQFSVVLSEPNIFS